MNDDELPLNAELASAYLDDELDPAERASVETDPDVMSMVDSFSRVHALLSESDDVDAGTRSAAIAAALAEFDARHVPSLVSPPIAAATVMSLQSRRMRAYRVVTRVAAVLVIGLVVAVAALNASRGNDAKSSSASDNTAAAAGAAADSAAELPQLKVAAADQTAGTAAAAATAIESASAPGPAINSREALSQYVAQLDGSSTPPAAVGGPSNQAPTAGGGFSLSCLTPDQTVLAPIVFEGRPAFAVRVQSSGALQAVDAADCRVLAHVP
jgi:hypothetical protein